MAVISCSRNTCAATYAVVGSSDSSGSTARAESAWLTAGSARLSRSLATHTSPLGRAGRAAAGHHRLPDRAVRRVGEVVAVDVLGHPADRLGVLHDELQRLALQGEPRVAQVGQRRRRGSLARAGRRPARRRPRSAGRPRCRLGRRSAPRVDLGPGLARCPRRPCRPARGRTPPPWTGRGSRRPAWPPPGPRRCGRRPGRGRSAHDVAQHEAVERHPAGDELAHGGVALLQAQVARVEAVGLHRDVRLAGEALVALERPQRRLLSGGVPVEGEDHLAAELVVVLAAAGAAPGCGPHRTRCRRWRRRWVRRPGGRPSRRCSPRPPRPERHGRSRDGPGRCRRAPGSSCRSASRGC